MDGPIEPAELLQAEWPVHLMEEILNRLLEADLSVSDEQLTQRRLVRGVSTSSSTTTDDDDDDDDDEPAEEQDATAVEALLVTVLRASLTFAGKKLSGRLQSVNAAKVRVGGNQHAAPSQAASWCACALEIILNAPEAIVLSSSVYDVLRMHFVRFPRLGSMMLATVERAAGKAAIVVVEGKAAFVWPFVTLAVVSSKNCDEDITRDAAGKLAAYVRKMSSERVSALVHMLDEHARKDLLEVCVGGARPGGGLITKTLPTLMTEWPACRGGILRLAAAGLVNGSFSTWIDVLDLVGKCWRESYGVLTAEEQQSVMTVVQKLPELASSRAMRCVSCVARAVTRVAIVSSSSSCEAALLETARKLIMNERGPAPACGMFIASAMLRCGDNNNDHHDHHHFVEATALLEAGVSHRDDLIKCVAFDLVAEIMDEQPCAADLTAWSRKISSKAASTASSAVDGLSMLTMNEPPDRHATPPPHRLLLAALPGAVRLVFVDMRSEPGKHASLLRKLMGAVARVKDLTSAHLHLDNNTERFSAFRSLLEIMLDEAVMFPGTMKQQHFASASQPDDDVQCKLIEAVDDTIMGIDPGSLVEAHRRLHSILDGGSVASGSGDSTVAPLCRTRLRGCAKLLGIASHNESYFTAEDKTHVVDLSTRCLKDLSSASNYCFEDDVESALRDCATYAMTTWRAWRATTVSNQWATSSSTAKLRNSFTSYADVPLALELLRECVTVASARGDLDEVHKLVVQVTTEEERARASVSVAKRTNKYTRAGINLIRSAGRAGGHSPVCGITAMFADAFHHQACEAPDFDDLTAASAELHTVDDIVAATLNVMRALIRISSAEASGDAAFVVDASMNIMRDALFDAHVMTKSAHAANTMRLLLEYYRVVDTLPERVTTLAHILFEAAPHVAKGNLLDALRALMTKMEADLAVLFKGSNAQHGSKDGVLSDASAALHKTLDAIRVNFDTGGGGAMDYDSSGLPAFAVLALKAARHCLDVVHNMPPDSEELAAVITPGAKLMRSVEMLMRNQIIPQRVQTVLEPWRREIFVDSARMAERLSFDAKGRPRRKIQGLSGFLFAKGDAYLEEVLELQASLACKVDWVDEWPERPAPSQPPPVDGVSNPQGIGGGDDLLGELAKTASALGSTPHASSEEAERAPKKKKRRRDKNPFVEALKASEGFKGGTAEEYDDLEDFIVCKPGRDYKRLLGIGEGEEEEASWRGPGGKREGAGCPKGVQNRTAGGKFPAEVTAKLETKFRSVTHPSAEETEVIGQPLGLTAYQVKVWFMNRRSREKKRLSASGD